MTHGGEFANAEVRETPSLEQRAVRLLVTTLGLFFLAIFWCLLLQHGANAAAAGISFFGVNHHTVFIALVGYLIAAVGLWHAATLFKEGGLDPLVWKGLRVVAVTLPLLFATPYTQGTFFNWAHMVVGVTGSLVQLALALWVLRRYNTNLARIGFSVQLFGGIIGALSLPDWRFQVLLYGEAVFELGFGLALLAWTQHFAPAPSDD